MSNHAFCVSCHERLWTAEWVVDLTCRHQVQPPWDSFKEQNAVTLFQSGKLAMMLSATPSVPTFRQRATNVNWDVILYPKRAARVSSGGLTTYCVPSGTKLPDHGWAFLSFMQVDDAQKVYSASGGMLPSKIAQGKLYVEGGAGRPPKHSGLFVEAMKLGRKSPAAQNADAARRVYRPALEEAYRCNKPVRQVIQEVTGQVNAILAGR